MFKWLKQRLPTRETIQEHKVLAKLYHLLHYHYLWHFNRHSVSKAIAIGCFMTFVPMPMQMLPAALLAIIFRANVGISIATVWISNPITIPPLIFAAYKLGSWLIDQPALKLDFSQADAIWQLLTQAWQPFLIGCFSLSFITSVSGYFLARITYRLWISRKWKLNRQSRKLKT